MRPFHLSVGVALALALTAAHAAHAVQCGDVITEDTVLEADVGPCETGITVVGPAVLDLNGHAVTAGAVAPGMLIDLIGRGATLRNGIVTGAEDGVVLRGEGGHFVQGIFSAGHGIEGFLVLSDRNRLVGCVANGNDGNGFRVRGSGNRFRGNSASENRFHGFLIKGDRSRLRGNSANDNGANGYWFELGDGPSAGHAVQANAAKRNGSNGFLVTSRSTRLIRNRALENGADGIRNEGSYNAFAENVSLTNATFDLFEMRTGCTRTRWRDNVFATSNQACIE